MIAGYLRWQRHGLDEPQKVVEATAVYRDESDNLGRFIDDRCLLGRAHSVMSADLWEAWRSWCAGEGAEHGTQKAFARDLQRRGYDNSRHPQRGRMQWRGIGLEAL